MEEERKGNRLKRRKGILVKGKAEIAGEGKRGKEGK